MRKTLITAMIPPLSACRYACNTQCAAPITVFWLFGVVSVVFGVLGGPTNHTDVSWPTIALGVAMWAISSVWTTLTLSGVEADLRHSPASSRDRQVSPSEQEGDPLEEIRKAL
mgnify:CR=1 FL=1